jgi:DNA/RNA-binding protein KIN17
MRIFAENSGSIIDEFSQEFERGFVETMSHRHGTKRVQANRVYQEYIADKNHVHMNATIWTSLSEFVKYIGKEGKAVVDETEKVRVRGVSVISILVLDDDSSYLKSDN